ncbi:hypothetical protein V7S43_009122 [Phytophthora oleae]|uniref:PiggyBac transposable element-derived protein 4 C-terminal zinc-ribbon domain-containing protein n=1 Tax=Phytophthora oleae TaxID=2107226 RepID=A0ABD3FL11_9STRA
MRSSYKELQGQLLQVTAASELPDQTEATISGSHKLVEFPESTQIREGVRKRSQHQFKVCSIRKQKVGERSATRFYCDACSDGNKPVYLCDRVCPKH